MMVPIYSYWIAGILTVTVVIVTMVYLYFRQKYKYWKKRGVRYLEPTFPFGNLKDIMTQKKSIGEVFADLYDKLDGYKYGGVYHIQRPALIVRDPELIKNIMIKSFENFHDRGLYFDEKSDPLSGNLFNLSGTKWKVLRAKLSPTFTSGRIKMMFETLVKCGEVLRSYLKDIESNGEAIEFKDLLSRYSTDIIASCAFGIETNCVKHPDSEFRAWGRKIFEPTIKTGIRDSFRICAPAFAPLLNIPFVPKDVTKYFINVVKETISYRENGGYTRNDFMQLLIQMKNERFFDPDKRPKNTEEDINADKNKLTLEMLAAQALLFFVAGFESTSSAMSFCLYELANHMNIQKKLRDEINEVIKKHDGKVTYEAIHEMEYLDKVVSETLRLHPPVPILNRVCSKIYTIEETGDVIENGIPIVIPIYGLHRDPKYYPNPDVFNPENFSETAVKERPAFTYMPFGEGPRLCIGQRFGLMQVKVGLVSVLQDNEVTLSSKTTVPVKIDPKPFIASPFGGMWLNISKVN